MDLELSVAQLAYRSNDVVWSLSWRVVGSLGVPGRSRISTEGTENR